MIESLLANAPRVLAECAVAERLRRIPAVRLHPTLFNTPLIYGPDDAREAMASIYRQYIHVARESGLPLLLTAPTWRLDATRLANAGMPDSILQDAVDFIRSRRDEAPSDQPPIAVGGLIGPQGDCYRPDLAPSAVEAAQFHRPQIEQLAATGIDFLLAQTLPSVEEAQGIASVIAQTGTPYVMSFCCGLDGRVLDGTTLPEAMAKIDSAFSDTERPLGYFVNCTHPQFLLSAYAPGELSRLIGIQANGSSRDVTQLDGAETTISDPLERWSEAMQKLHHLHQVPVLGGCCGTDHRHLQALATG